MAVEYILPFINKGAKIWCPFDTEDSEFVKVFKENGFDVVHTHIWNGEDFFDIDVPKCDYIISNPPFSKIDDILTRLYWIDKPFAILINIGALFDSKVRYEIFSKNKFELFIPKGRIKFIDKHNNKNASPNFQSVYVCKDMLPSNIMFGLD